MVSIVKIYPDSTEGRCQTFSSMQEAKDYISVIAYSANLSGIEILDIGEEHIEVSINNQTFRYQIR